MDNPSVFAAGESLLPVEGDPRRQAVASLRGYAYQLYVSSLAWVGLQPGDILYLEVAEDYAVLAGQHLRGVQVKDTAKSSTLTINNQDALDALDSFVDLVERNPSRTVQLRYLTTSEIGRERDKGDQVNGDAVLLYWRKAAAVEDVEPLRTALLNSSASARFKRFITSRTNEQVRQDLLRRVHWDTGAPPLADVQSQLAASLVEFGSDRLRLTPSDCATLPDAVLVRVLDAVVQPVSSRILSLGELLTLCEKAGRTSLPNATLDGLLAMLAPSSGASQLRLGARAVFEVEATYPAIDALLPRPQLIDAVNAALKACAVVFLIGGSGMGKTTAARTAARRLGGKWLVLPLLDRTAQETERVLATAVGQAATQDFNGLIVDDLNEIESAPGRRQFAQLLRAVRRRDAVCIVTAYRDPTISTLDACELPPQAVIRVPSHSREEVARLVSSAGGDPARSADLVYLLSSGGHPQLARAVIAGAQRSGWPSLEMETVSISEVQADLDSERRRLRRSLVDRLGADSRRLLLRASLLHGRFSRELVRSLADVEPELAMPGELLNSLLGPWIDELGRDRLRVSPLVGNAGAEDLSQKEQLATHAHAARWLAPADQSVEATIVNALFFHSMHGEVDEPLTRIALAVMTTPHAMLGRVADVFPLLVHASTVRRIFGKNANTSKLLRFAQLLLVSETDEARGALPVWEALQSEMQQDAGSKAGRLFEVLVLSKALISSTLPAVLPEPMQLLRRLFELMSIEPDLSSLKEGFEDSRPERSNWTGSLASFLFIVIAMKIGTVARQQQLFEQLDACDDDERHRFLPNPESGQGWVQTVVNAAWLSESQANTLRPLDAAASFERLEALCLGWSRRDMAVRFRVARAVMHDEYQDAPDVAERLLVEAESVFGSNAVISRAKVRLRFRHKKYQDVLSELVQGPDATQDGDPLERALLCREAGVSAAGVGDWAVAAQWLSRAHQAVQDSIERGPPQLRIGLRADAALAAFRSGERQGSVAEYGEAVQELVSLDPESSLGAAYCHRVVRHGLLWMYAEARGDATDLAIDGKAPFMLAGMCSNLDPPEAIRSLELAHVDTAWYLQAAVEARYLGNAGARSNLAARLRGREVVALEPTSRAAFVECAIRRRSAEEFADAVGPWMDCIVHVFANMEELKQRSLARPEYGSLPAASETALMSPPVQENLADAVVSFAISCALANDRPALEQLGSALRGTPGSAQVLGLIERLLVAPAGEDGSQLHRVEAVVRLLLGKPELSPTDLYVVTFRLLEVCRRSTFRRVLDGMFVAWSKAKWQDLVSRPFLLRAAPAVIPAIEAALRRPGCQSVALMLRTSRIGFAVGLPESAYVLLRSIEEEAALVAASA